MPANRLTFAVRVSRENKFVVIFQGVNNRFNVLFAVARDLPFHVEIFFGQHGAVLRRKVSYVTVGGEHGVVAPQILVDCLGLSGRLDDDNWHGNPLKNEAVTMAAEHGVGR